MSRVERAGHQPGDPYAKITRVGRWVYEIEIHRPVEIRIPAAETTKPDGPDPAAWIETTTSPPWLAFTRRGAERKARRKLRRHLRLKAYREET